MTKVVPPQMKPKQRVKVVHYDGTTEYAEIYSIAKKEIHPLVTITYEDNDSDDYYFNSSFAWNEKEKLWDLNVSQ